MQQAQTPVELQVRNVFRPSAEVFEGVGRRPLLRYDAELGLSLGDKPPMGPAGVLSSLDRGFLFFFLASLLDIDDDFLLDLREAGNAYRLDESLEFFKKVTSAEKPDGELIVSDDGWSQSFLAPLFIPRHVVEILERSYDPKKPDYSLMQSDLSFLAALNELMGFNASDLRMDVAVQSRRAQNVQINNLLFRFRWKDDTFVTHHQLSYGQKRLVSFFYYLACNPIAVIADELVNGLHHRWITASIEAIGQRQAFLTSQNPLLLDYVPITSAEEVRRSFVLGRGEPREGRPGWIWENMSEEDARELFSAYGVGIEHVSEILQSRGLW
jgi:hypothetical protein